MMSGSLINVGTEEGSKDKLTHSPNMMPMKGRFVTRNNDIGTFSRPSCSNKFGVLEGDARRGGMLIQMRIIVVKRA